MSDDLLRSMQNLNRTLDRANKRRTQSPLKRGVMGTIMGLGATLGCFGYLLIILISLTVSVGVPLAIGYAALKFAGVL